MSDILSAIDAVTGTCPCGAPPALGSRYCSEDCRPTHIAADTDLGGPGAPYATPARWTPQRSPDVHAPPAVAQAAPRPVSASVTIRLSDGEEWTYDLHKGARDFNVEIQIDRDDDADIGGFGLAEPLRSIQNTHYRIEVDARYGGETDRHLTLTRRHPNE